MLSDAEIKEIEKNVDFHIHCTGTFHIGVANIRKLLATVKEQRKEITEQRELLRKASEYIQCFPSCTESAHPCSCGADQLQKQIEEKVK